MNFIFSILGILIGLIVFPLIAILLGFITVHLFGFPQYLIGII